VTGETTLFLPISCYCRGTYLKSLFSCWADDSKTTENKETNILLKKKWKIYRRTWRSHNGGYEEFCVLVYNAM
jgi:hypothetical protein